jgi:hypothetical protein
MTMSALMTPAAMAPALCWPLSAWWGWDRMEEEVEGRMKARETQVRSGFFSNSERHSQRPVFGGAKASDSISI